MSGEQTSPQAQAAIEKNVYASAENSATTVKLLQRIAGDLNVIKWGVGLAVFALFMLLLSHTH